MTYRGLDDERVLKRKIASLEECMAKYPDLSAKLVAVDIPKGFDSSQLGNIEIVPLWQLLLE